MGFSRYVLGQSKGLIIPHEGLASTGIRFTGIANADPVKIYSRQNRSCNSPNIFSKKC